MSRQRDAQAALDYANAIRGALRDALEQMEHETSEPGELAIRVSLDRAARQTAHLVTALARLDTTEAAT